MKLQAICQPLLEMGKPAQICDKCGHGPMSKTHYYYKGEWKCKNAPAPGYPKNTQSGTAPQSSTGSSAPSPAPATTPSHPVASTPASTSTASAPPATPRKITPVAGGPSVTIKPTSSPATDVVPARDHDQMVRQFLDEFKITDFTKESDGSYTVHQSVDMTGCLYKKIPVKFNKVEGDMKLSSYVRSLANCPTEVTEDFDLVMLKHIKDLTGGPKTVGGEYCVLSCSELESIDGVASEIGGDFECKDCVKLKSLKGIHEKISSIGPNGRMDFGGSGIKEAVLGILLIDSVKSVNLPNVKVTEIVNKYLASEDRGDISECQEELIKAGFEDWADL